MDRVLADELREAVDDAWAETVRHLPLSDGRQDPMRAVSAISCVLRTGERDAAAVNFGRSGGSGVGVMADGGYLRIDRGDYPDLIMRKGDKVVALDRTSQPIFEVVSVDDRSHLRLICELGDVGR